MGYKYVHYMPEGEPGVMTACGLFDNGLSPTASGYLTEDQSEVTCPDCISEIA